jgi:hypothetical protein
VAVEGLDGDKMRTIDKDAIGLMWDITLLEGFLGFEHRLVMSKVKDRGEIHAINGSRHAWEECGLCPVSA